jgi:hypothetical protein
MFLLGAAVLMASGCSQSAGSSDDLRKELADASDKLAKMQVRLNEVVNKNSDLNARLSKVESSDAWRALIDEASATAFLTPGSEGYAIVKIDVGFMTVNLTNIQPYANGTRVTILFGNPTSANLNGTKATFEWGKVDSQGIVKDDTVKSREVSFTESLTAGSWTTIHVVLDGVPASDLGFVRVKSLTHQGMSLRRN